MSILVGRGIKVAFIGSLDADWSPSLKEEKSSGIATTDPLIANTFRHFLGRGYPSIMRLLLIDNVQQYKVRFSNGKWAVRWSE